ncbi:MAG: hypothetical protein WA414_10560, partial [Acidobacteriaceae bacterium]
MNIVRKTAVFCSIAALFSLALLTSAQTGADAILPAPAAAKVLPDAVFFAGKSANTQLRNAAGVHFADGAYALAVLVDTSGYSTAVQQKYQGYLLTEAPLEFAGHHLAPGAYGFGFLRTVQDDLGVVGEPASHFLVMDIGNHDLFQADAVYDAQMHRPMPMQ